jgi:membrane-associated progesterone receptor component
MADNASGSSEQKARFEPKQAVQLDPPKDDPITEEYLSKCNGE